MLKGIQQTFQRGIGRAAAIGMAAHPVNDDQQCSFVVGRNGDTILIVFPVSDQTQVSMLDPQERLRAERAINCYTLEGVDEPCYPGPSPLPDRNLTVLADQRIAQTAVDQIVLAALYTLAGAYS